MKNKLFLTLTLVLIIVSLNGLFLFANNETAEKSKLAVLWTSGDVDVAERVCFMYTHNAKKAGWFDEVTLIVWGPSAKLLSENEKLQASVKQMIEDGVTVEACKACADSYGVADDLTELGIPVKYMGRPLTEILKSDTKLLTF